MLASALILGFAGVALPAAVGTVSSIDNTAPAPDRHVHTPAAHNEFDRRFSLELRLGIATPTGALGIAAEVAPIPRLGVGCGVGSNLLGAEYACWLRARPMLSIHEALTLSTGLSRGRFVQNPTTQNGVFGLLSGPLSSIGHGPDRAEREFEHAYWLNSDIGYESRQSGFLFRMFIGGAALLNPSDGVERVWSSSELPAEPALAGLVYAGLGIGIVP